MARPKAPTKPPEKPAAEKKSAPKGSKQKSLARIPEGLPDPGNITQSGHKGKNASPTPESVARFLKAVGDECGNVTEACRISGVPRDWVYTECKRNPDFKKRFEEARSAGVDSLEDIAFQRAGKGWTKDVWYQGEVVGKERVMSNSLMCFLLKGNRPEKYKDRIEHTGNPNAPMSIEVGPTPLVMGFLEGLKEADEEKKKQ